MADGAAFCTKCGNKVQKQEEVKAAEEKVAMVVEMKTGLLKTEMGVLLIGRTQSALIQVEKKKYTDIVASGNQGGSFFQKVSGMSHAFGVYAAGLAGRPLQDVIAENPGSILFQNDQIKTIRIWKESDPNTDGYMTYFSYELNTAGGKYKGTLDRGLSRLDDRLKDIFGKKLKLH